MCLLAGGREAGPGKVVAGSVLFEWEGGAVVDLGRMNQPRYGHSAAFVEGEGVYVVGGRTEGPEPGCLLDGCEVYVVERRAWRLVSPLNQGRVGCALLVYRRRLFVLGGVGENGQAMESIEWYDGGRNRWEEFRHSLPCPMDGMGVLACEDHARVLIVGGRVRGERVATVWEFDMDDGGYVWHSDMGGRRGYHRVLALDNQWVVVGGEVDRMRCEVFEEGKGWRDEAKVSWGLEKQEKEGVGVDGMCWVERTVVLEPVIQEEEEYEEVDLGAYDLDRMSEEAVFEVMEKKRRMNLIMEKRKKEQEGAVKKKERGLKDKPKMERPGDFLIGFGSELLPFIVRVNIQTGEAEFGRVTNEIKIGSGFHTVRLMGAKLLMWRTGGGTGASLSYYIFDLKEWEARPLKSRRKQVVGSCFQQVEEDGFYLVGGFRETSPNLASNAVEYYHIPTDSWTTCASLLITRKGLSTFSHKTMLYVVGGVNNDKEVEQSIERYDSESNTWNIISLKHVSKIYDGICGEVKGKLYYFGGKSKPGKPIDAVYEIDPDLSACKFAANIPLLQSSISYRLISVNRNILVVKTEYGYVMIELGDDFSISEFHGGRVTKALVPFKLDFDCIS